MDEKPKYKKPMSEKQILARKLGGVNRWKKAKEKQLEAKEKQETKEETNAKRAEGDKEEANAENQYIKELTDYIEYLEKTLESEFSEKQPSSIKPSVQPSW